MMKLLFPLLFATLCLAGCLRHEETLVVGEDGAIDVTYELVGDAEDLGSGPARKPSGKRWKTSTNARTKEDGSTETVWRAEARFASAQAYPRSFAAKDDPFRSRALRFTTTLTTRRDGNKTYYRLERTYQPRAWASYGYMRRRCFSESIRKLYEDPDHIAKLPTADKHRLLDAVVQYQCLQAKYWSLLALRSVRPRDPQIVDVELDVSAEIDAYRKAVLRPAAVVSVMDKPVDEIVSFADRVLRKLTTISVERAVAGLQLTPAERAAFEWRLRLERHDFDVTHDLDDEDFLVRVRMPGHVIGSNAQETADGALVWRFQGRDLRDRAHRLIATSFREH